MSEKRPAESLTEEPPIKKHKQITPEMYEKLEAENAELKKRDTEAQKMTQEMIEKLQSRTAVAEEEFEKGKNAIELSSKAELEPTLLSIKKAVDNGEFDTLLEEQLAYGSTLEEYL